MEVKYLAKNIWLLLMILVMFIGAGCIGSSTIPPREVEIHIRWDGLSGFLPGVNNNFGSEERRVGKECRSRWSPYH